MTAPAEEGPDPQKNLTMEQRRFIFQRDGRPVPNRAFPTEIQSAINRALHQEGVPHFIRVLSLRRNDNKVLTGLTTPLASAEQFLAHKATIVRAARTFDAGITDVDINQIWVCLRAYGIPQGNYTGLRSHGTDKLRAEIEAENADVEIPFQIRWLGRMGDIKKRQKKGRISVSSVSFVVKGEKVGQRLIQHGIFINGRVHRVDRYLEACPDSLCANCSTWGHIEAQCAFPLCSLRTSTPNGGPHVPSPGVHRQEWYGMRTHNCQMPGLQGPPQGRLQSVP